nr:PREDICTED: uncharacterized protein LOC103280469 [Anolis carolinensis]|eukprot:XP_008117817.1 PREDICTED: uncharacterized protein LOC103280469 [Anolis carolinensis]
MAANAEEGMLGSIFPIFIAALLFAVTVCFLVLCTLCQRKNRIPAPDGELLAEATELSSLRGSVTTVQKLGRTNSRAKNLSPATITIPCDDDGTISSCSFIILPQRELPQPPSADPVSPEQTYSNLTFLKRSQEVLYETVAVKGDEEKEPDRVAEETVAGKDPVDHETADGYAKVQKGKKKKKTFPEPETRTKPTIQESDSTATASTPTTLKLEEMYAVVCKDKKKKKAKNGVILGKNGGPQVERSRGCCQAESVPRASEGMEGPQSSLFQPHFIEPCYASISCEPRADFGEKEIEEPAYETVETHWKKPRKKGKPKSKAAAATENLYESIENLAF